MITVIISVLFDLGNLIFSFFFMHFCIYNHHVHFRSYADPLTNAMVEFYLQSQEHFTQDMQPHYVYSPREMTRWVRGICEAIR